MDLVYVAQGLVTVLLAVVGWLWTKTDSKLDRLHEDHMMYKTHVAEQYVNKEALKELSNALFAKLDKIESKLDLKQDKP